MKTLLISFLITLGVGGAVLGAILLVSDMGDDSTSPKTASEEAINSDDTISDEVRKAYVSLLLSAAQNYAANNNGTFKIDGQSLVSDGYMEFDDGEEFEIVQEAPRERQLEYRVAQVCTSSNELEPSSSVRVVAVRVQLNDGSYYCSDNQ